MARSVGIGCVLAVLASLAVLSLVRAGRHALADSADLERRAVEVAYVLRGESPYQSDDMTYPPTAPVVFVPLVAPFPDLTSLRAGWLVLNLGFLGLLAWLVVRLWGRRWPPWVQAAFVLVVLASRPVRVGIGLGQFHLIPVVLMLLAVGLVRRQRPTVAGLLVGMALVKPTMTLPFLAFLVARRQWRALGSAIGFQAVAWLGIAAWLNLGPLTLIREWFRVARSQEASGMIDVPSLVLRAWPDAPIGSSTIALVILGLTFLGLWRLRDRSDLGLVSLSLLVAGVFTYHRAYDLVLMVPAFAYLIDQARREPRRIAMTAAVAVFAAMLIAPEHPQATGPFESWYAPVFVTLSYVFLGLTVFFVSREPGWSGQVAGSTDPPT